MSELQKKFEKTKKASLKLLELSSKKIQEILEDLSKNLIRESPKILAANQKDLQKMDQNDPRYDRLLLTFERLKQIAHQIKSVKKLPDPTGKILEQKTLPNKLRLKKISVPFGVVGVIYEARPNVTVDVFSLCLKSRNACVLKGGSDAYHSNLALVKVVHTVLKKHQVSSETLLFLSPDRKEVEFLLKANQYVDVLIPRGSGKLIEYVRENATVPVIETGAGVVHTYVDKTADITQAARIIFNSKTRRPSVCNALDTLIVHENQLKNLGKLVELMQTKNVEIYADQKSYRVLQKFYPKTLLFRAREENFGMEYLSHKMSIKTVENIEEALLHIAKYSSGHSEAILSKNRKNIEKFFLQVDAACVYSNASTAFTDGGEFGMGAEIGISTQKLHARGPMALPELTSYKWIVEGDGQVR